jgi:Holliday junction resolvase RusA-like endonuclease
MTLFEVEIPGRAVIKKNTMRRAGRAVYYTAAFLAWEKHAEFAVRMKRATEPDIAFPFSKPMELHLDFHFKSHQWEGDTSNYVEGPQDLLQKCGVIENDKLIYEIRAKKIFDGTERTIIKLYDLTKQER